MNVPVDICMYMYVCVYVCVRVHAGVRVCVRVCGCVRMCAYVCARASPQVFHTDSIQTSAWPRGIQSREVDRGRL